jgi:hypothetical protein
MDQTCNHRSCYHPHRTNDKTRIQSYIQNSSFLVEWRPTNPFNDDDDPDYIFEAADCNNNYDDSYDNDYDRDDAMLDDDTVVVDNFSIPSTNVDLFIPEPHFYPRVSRCVLLLSRVSHGRH